MASQLKKLYPIIREREEILAEIERTPFLSRMFHGWEKQEQRRFLDMCTGVRGAKILYDPFFKEIMNPEYTPGRMEAFLSVILRQNAYIHYLEARSDTGIEIDLLQKYVFVSLDNFRKRSHNEIIKNELEAWLTFFATEEPGQIANLIAAYPDFRSLYADVYNICQNTERVMKMFSKELQIIDENTVQYMMDELQAKVDELQEKIDERQEELDEKDKALNKKDQEIAVQQQLIAKLQKELEQARK